MIQRNIHHQGANPSRTCLVAPEQEKHSQKWAPCFETWITFKDGMEHLMTRITAAALYDTAVAAYEAGGRAMDHFQEHDRWPNLCEQV